MDKATLENMIASIKHPGGKQFAIAIVKAAANEIIGTHSSENPNSVKTDKQKRKTIIQEVVDCIVAQNPHKKKFGLCISERKIKKELFIPFCKVLETNKHLSSLSLVRCEFQSEECYEGLSKMLQNNTSMTSLNLSQTRLSKEGITYLAEGLKTNTTVTELFLDNIGMSDESAVPFANILVGSNLQKIKTIDLAYNNIGSVGFDAILKNAKNNIRSSDIRVKGNSNISTSKIKELEAVLLQNKCIAGAIDEVLNRAFVEINVAIRVSQTAALMAVQSSRAVPGGLSRGRSRGGTIDISSTPAHLLNATADCEPMEDCGNSKSTRYVVGESHTRGRRKDMQDATLLQGKFNENDNEDLFCVFDGHGSQEPAIYAAKNIPVVLKEKITAGDDIVTSLTKAFEDINNQMKPFAVQSGTTAVTCFIKDDILYVANVGDSRAVLYRNGKAIRLTVDHKPSLEGETERIEYMGGIIKNNRVQGALAVTRALGDWFAGDFVSPDPYVTRTQLTKEDKKLIIACDGLFDVFSDDAVADMVKDIEDPHEAATKLKDEAFNAGSMDNISVVVVNFGSNHTNELSSNNEPQVIKGLWKHPDGNNEDKEESQDNIDNQETKDEQPEDSAEVNNTKLDNSNDKIENNDTHSSEEEEDDDYDEEEEESEIVNQDIEEDKDIKIKNEDIVKEDDSNEKNSNNIENQNVKEHKEKNGVDTKTDSESNKISDSKNKIKIESVNEEDRDSKLSDEPPKRRFSAILVDSLSEGDSGETSIPTEYASAEESDVTKRPGVDLCTSCDA